MNTQKIVKMFSRIITLLVLLFMTIVVYSQQQGVNRIVYYEDIYDKHEVWGILYYDFPYIKIELENDTSYYEIVGSTPEYFQGYIRQSHIALSDKELVVLTTSKNVFEINGNGWFKMYKIEFYSNR